MACSMTVAMETNNKKNGLESDESSLAITSEDIQVESNKQGPTLSSGEADVTKTEKDDLEQVSIEEMRVELEKLRKENAKLRDENGELKQLRKKVDGEIDELTAALFEEAYKMVNGAHERRAKVEKHLEDVRGKVFALETENNALKTVVESAGKLPSSGRPSTAEKSKESSFGFSKKKTSKGRRSSSVDLTSELAAQRKEREILQFGKVNLADFASFKEWYSKKSISKESVFIQNIHQVDIMPCMNFENQELSEQVLLAVEESTLFMEKVPDTVENSRSRTISKLICHRHLVLDLPHPLMSPEEHNELVAILRRHELVGGMQCSLCYLDERCSFRMKLDETGSWYYISEDCRNRVASVCDLYMTLNHVYQGLVKMDAESLYWEIARLRAGINLTRLHLKLVLTG